MILIDSSSSMTNPKHGLSYAVLGAGCAADAYIRNGAAVAVCNFSDGYAEDCRLLPYTRRREAIYEALCHYFGGGTKLRVEDIERLQKEPLPDIFLITDMQITNLKKVMAYLTHCQNRITAVHLTHNEHVRAFRRSMAPQKNSTIYAVERKEDIPRIVLGRIRQYLGLP
jgi:uncharacterized protein with von Willebrand factor type A (vWA) domain